MLDSLVLSWLFFFRRMCAYKRTDSEYIIVISIWYCDSKFCIINIIVAFNIVIEIGDL